MQKRQNRSSKGFVLALESLEGRVVLSTAGAAIAATVGTAHVSVRSTHKVSTETNLSIQSGTLGSPITFNVTVAAPHSSSQPTGTVKLVQHGQVIASLNLTPSSQTRAKMASSTATETITPQPGGPATYFGKYPITAQFVPSGSFLKSAAHKVLTVSLPHYTTLAGGVKVATIVNGSGPAIQSGQTAHVLYTGYLASNGHIFDNSLKDGGPPFSFTVGAGQVVPGFDTGTLGMQVGETRVVEIPAAQGYGAAANGMIPANSTLIFVMTLESIS